VVIGDSLPRPGSRAPIVGDHRPRQTKFGVLPRTGRGPVPNLAGSGAEDDGVAAGTDENRHSECAGPAALSKRVRQRRTGSRRGSCRSVRGRLVDAEAEQRADVPSGFLRRIELVALGATVDHGEECADNCWIELAARAATQLLAGDLVCHC